MQASSYTGGIQSKTGVLVKPSLLRIIDWAPIETRHMMIRYGCSLAIEAVQL